MTRARLGQVLSKNQVLRFSVLPGGCEGPPLPGGGGGAILPPNSPRSSATSSLPGPLLMLPSWETISLGCLLPAVMLHISPERPRD